MLVEVGFAETARSLQFLFTVGMTLVDSLDSVLMLYAYASPSRSTPEGKLGLFQSQPDKPESESGCETDALLSPERREGHVSYVEDARVSAEQLEEVETSRVVDNKLNVMSSLSITLTALSIVVALRYAHYSRSHSTVITADASWQYFCHRDHEHDW